MSWSYLSIDCYKCGKTIYGTDHLRAGMCSKCNHEHDKKVAEVQEKYKKKSISQNQPLQQKAFNGSDSIKSCQNCKFYTSEKNRCNHQYWSWCIKRDDDGYVTTYAYHHFR